MIVINSYDQMSVWRFSRHAQW